MNTEAAILVELGQPLVLAELEIPPLENGQVLVEIQVSGVCRTQVMEWRGHRGEDRYLPHCLGHEAAGIVRETGPGVTKVAESDLVILSWIKGSGLDVAGVCYRWGDRTVNAGGVTTFSRLAVVSESRLVRRSPGVRLEDAAVLGCALATGFGAVFNVARPMVGDSVVVWGAGRIGLAAIVAASTMGCVPVIAVDREPEKLAVARRLGATHTFESEDALARVLDVCPGGVDVAVEASGLTDVMVAAVRSVRARGGSAVVIGNARHGQVMRIDPGEFNQGKRLLGTWGGDTVPDRDITRYCRLLESGLIDLTPMTQRRYRLDQATEALADLEAGRVVRPLIVMDESTM